jgi:amino acid permease
MRTRAEENDGQKTGSSLVGRRLAMVLLVWPALSIVFAWAWTITLMVTLLLVAFSWQLALPVLSVLAPSAVLYEQGTDVVRGNLLGVLVLAMGCLSAVVACVRCWPRRMLPYRASAKWRPF